MELFLKNWYKKLLDELSRTKELKIISPFVKEQIIVKIQNQFNFKNLQLITRFNLRDFALNVSSLSALKFAVENDAKVYGICDLHSKVYLFDKRAAIISSSNLTYGGLVSNFECGIFLTDIDVIKNLHQYFNELKTMGGNELTIQNCEKWEKELSGIIIPKGKANSLPDYGASLKTFDKSKTYYVKFFGSGNNRETIDCPITRVIEGSFCHYACTFPLNKKPRQVNEGDIMYMARMTKNPNDYVIFGKAIAMEYMEGRDIASKKEIEEKNWKAKWPYYIRVKSPVFVKGILADGVALSDLVSKFDYNSFPSTRERYDKGEKEINPSKSLMRKPYIKLTHDSAEWLEQKFKEAINAFGKIEDSFLKRLPKTTTDLTSWVK